MKQSETGPRITPKRPISLLDAYVLWHLGRHIHSNRRKAYPSLKRLARRTWAELQVEFAKIDAAPPRGWGSQSEWYRRQVPLYRWLLAREKRQRLKGLATVPELLRELRRTVKAVHRWFRLLRRKGRRA
jgi:hypothetical protein